MPTDDRKTCSKCYRTKALDEFYKDKGKLDGHYAWCKSCQRFYQHGITEDQFNWRLYAQGGRCAVCKSTDPGRNNETFSVDHDHACCPGGKSCGECIRGLLCHNCNSALGLLRDDVGIITALAIYAAVV